MRARLLVLIGILALLPVVSAYGQEKVKANVPFQFTAEGKVYPAGEYTFTPDELGQSISLTGPANVSGYAMVITRLAGEMHTTPEDAHVVFDKVGDSYFLSEIWITGEDGYLLNSTKEKHTHRIINVPR